MRGGAAARTRSREGARGPHRGAGARGRGQFEGARSRARRQPEHGQARSGAARSRAVLRARSRSRLRRRERRRCAAARLRRDRRGRAQRARGAHRARARAIWPRASRTAWSRSPEAETGWVEHRLLRAVRRRARGDSASPPASSIRRSACARATATPRTPIGDAFDALYRAPAGLADPGTARGQHRPAQRRRAHARGLRRAGGDLRVRALPPPRAVRDERARGERA